MLPALGRAVTPDAYLCGAIRLDRHSCWAQHLAVASRKHTLEPRLADRSEDRANFIDSRQYLLARPRSASRFRAPPKYLG
jgi:hypothetical protein